MSSPGLTPQELEQKLGSPNEFDTRIRRVSNSQPQHLVIPQTNGSESETSDAPSSLRNAQAPLSVISEASDAGSDSDSSVLEGAGENRRPLSAVTKAMDRIRLSMEATRTSDHCTVKSGYLMKKGERRKAWQKRWFVLRGGQLAMYKTDKEYRLLRLIPLNEIHACAPVELKKHSFTFGIVTVNRTYYVEANSETEVRDWCATVEAAKEEIKGGTTVTSLDPPSAEGERTPMEHPATLQMSAAIPIPGTSSMPQLGGVAGSYSTSVTSNSPPNFSPPSIASTSYTTSSSRPTPSLQPRPPPNSYASAAPPHPNQLELETLDAGLEQAARSATFTSTNTGSSAGTDVSYFNPPPPRLAIRTNSMSSNTNIPPPSPGGMTSSDDDGYDTYEPTFASEGPTMREGKNISFESTAVATTGFGDPNKVILAGYLMKQGKRRNWRKRWFVLMSGRLVYSRSHMDTKVHRQIPVSQILDAIEFETTSSQPAMRRPLSSTGLSAVNNSQSAPEEGSKKNYQHTFKIITPKRTYLVCAPNEEEEIKWLAALQCLVARRTSVNAGAGLGRSSSIAGIENSPRVPRARSLTVEGRAAVETISKRFHPAT